MQISSWVVLIGALGLLSGCGSDDSADGGGGGTSSGGTGGDTSGDGGTTSTGGATTNTGGTATGGDAGGTGEGGAGNDACPEEAPTVGDDCTNVDVIGCTYEDSGCWCPTFGPNAGEWQCSETPGTCTDDEPETGVCTGGDTCTHAGGFCYCAQNSMWVCFGG